jgi:hypothetical protein
MSEAEKFSPFSVEFVGIGAYMTAKLLGRVERSTRKINVGADKVAVERVLTKNVPRALPGRLARPQHLPAPPR